jgi:hypothetical protein
MFTVEFDHDDMEIVIVDDTGNNDDLKINAFDDIVYIRQYREDLHGHQTIVISPQMWEELIAAIQSPEGAFVRR